MVARPQGGGGGGGGGGKSGGGFITPVDIHKETEIHFKVPFLILARYKIVIFCIFVLIGSSGI